MNSDCYKQVKNYVQEMMFITNNEEYPQSLNMMQAG